jgi:hypothetical protein
MLGLRRRMSEDRVIRAAELLFRDWHSSESEQVAALKEDGFTDGEAVRFISLVPTAFITPELEEHNVTLHPEVSGRDAQGNWVLAKLSNQPEYMAALKLARRHKRKSVIDNEVFQLIAESSAEADVLRKALAQGIDVSGGIVATSLPAPNIACYLVGQLRPFPSTTDVAG